MNVIAWFLVLHADLAVIVVVVPLIALQWMLVATDRKRIEWLLVAAIWAEPATLLSKGIAEALSRLRPMKYDLYIYRIDQIFGEPSFRIGQEVASHLWFGIILNVVYVLLPIAMLGTLAVYLWLRRDAEVFKVVRIFVLNLFMAVPIYALIPVCGPEFAFRNLPAASEVQHTLR